MQTHEKIDASYNRTIFAQNLKYYMKQHRFSSKDVALKIGVSEATLSGWRKGTYYPRIYHIEMLAELFHISKSDLIEKHSVKKESKPALKEETPTPLFQIVVQVAPNRIDTEVR